MKIRKYIPYSNFRFLLEIEGMIVGGFSEVSVLQTENEVDTLNEGGVNDKVSKLPKRLKYPNLTMKRGITDSKVLWNWYQDVISGNIEKKSVYIILLDSKGDEKGRWRFIEAFPVKWTGPEYRDNEKIIAVESFELTFKGIMKA